MRGDNQLLPAPADCLFTSDLRKLAADCGVAIQQCQRTGQLSRAVRLHEAREALLAAVNIPGRDERQLTLDTERTPTNEQAKRTGN